MNLDAGSALVERFAAEWADEVLDAASWEPETSFRFAWRSLSMKHQATNAAFRAVDRALDVAGGFGVSRGGPLERLFRDARMGRLDLDASPRWG